jgi:hypothetical protein
MGMAPVAHVVWNKFMTFNPKNPEWLNRDRFVLSYVFYTFFIRVRPGSRFNGWWAKADCRTQELKQCSRAFPRTS